MTSGCAPDRNGTWSCTLSRGGGYEALVLWNSSKTVSYPVPARYIDARDLMGNVDPLNEGSLQVGDMPLLVETGRAF